MNPWRAALTSATASGKRTRIASRSAVACSSEPPVGCICFSAAAVSSTAGAQRQCRELLALRVLDALRLRLCELAQPAEDLLGITAEREEAAAFHPVDTEDASHGHSVAVVTTLSGTRTPRSTSRRSSSIVPWALFSAAVNGTGRRDRGPARAASWRRRSRRAAPATPLRRRPDRPLERTDCVLGLVDPLRALGQRAVRRAAQRSSSRSPPAADSSAISHSAAIVTASLTSLRAETTAPSSSSTSQEREPSAVSNAQR